MNSMSLARGTLYMNLLFAEGSAAPVGGVEGMESRDEPIRSRCEAI